MRPAHGLALVALVASTLLVDAGPQFLERATVAYRPPDWTAAEVGVVVAYCDDDLSNLWRYASCSRHNVYVYMRCGPAEAFPMEAVPEALRQCVSVHVLNDEVIHANLGRAHHAYLTHIIDNYDNLNPVTAFLKGSKGFSGRLFGALGPKTSFWQLGCEQRTCGRKGPIKAGAAARLRQDIQQAIDVFGFNTSVTGGFTKFRSQFAASRERLRSVSKERYQYLKDFVLDPSPEQAACHDPGKCCNCEVMERIWAHVLGCGDEMSAMSTILQEYRPVKWSPVLTRFCYNGHQGPVMRLKHDGDPRQQRAAMLTGLYLAALLRWRVLLPNPHPQCPGGDGCGIDAGEATGGSFEELFDQQHFVSYAAEKLGVAVLTEVPQGYKPLKKSLLTCRAQGGCMGTPESVVKMYQHVMGPYLVPPPGPFAITVSTVKHARAIRLANRAFRHSPQVKEAAERLLSAAKQGGTLVALYLHQDSHSASQRQDHDDSAHSSFGQRLLNHFHKWGSLAEDITLYIASELSTVEARAHPGLRPLLEAFPGIRVVDKGDLGIPQRTLPNTHAAVDSEVAFRADRFIGVTASTFSAFVGLKRRSKPGKTTTILPTLEDQEICHLSTSQERLGHWQTETSLPYNDCVMGDPCSMIYCNATGPLSSMTPRSCPTESSYGDNYCMPQHPCWHCTGMAAALGRCPQSVQAQVRTRMNVKEVIPIL